ncbi:MAG: ribonuclease H-like domain-containing protein [Vicinamibacterales bacterium]
MSLTERLRSVVRPAGGSAALDHARSYVRGPGSTDGHSSSSVDPVRADAVADVLDGEWRESSGQRYLVIERAYPPGHRHGHTAVADGVPEHDGCWPALAVLEPAIARTRVLFIDLETTGLAGGAGTYAFLVGCAWFDGATFRVRQFLLARFGAERGLLEDVADTASGAGALATYNGKTFDLPLIDTRFLLHRMTTPFTGMPHVDLLHAARRLWRPAETGGSASWDSRWGRTPDVETAGCDSNPVKMQRSPCCLTAVEQSVLGHVREHDVPGHEVPSRYFHYVRSGDPRPLVAVLEHNRLDLLSLALLTARTARLLGEGVDAARTASEALGLGHLYQRGSLLAEARACFARASAMRPADPCTTAEALRAYAVLSRRARQHDEAVRAWQRILELRVGQPRLMQEASEALAVHHEHREEDLHLARDFARQSLQFTTSASRVRLVRHRLTRLDRKLGGAQPGRRAGQEAVPLF